MALDPVLRDRILASVDAGFDAQLAFTQDMIRHPSIRGQEHTMQDFMFRAMKERGLTMDRFAMDEAQILRHPGAAPFSDTHSTAPIVVGIHHPREEKGRSLIMQGHVDVVPAGPLDMWTNPPFEPVIKGDWLYGRGGTDMKCGTAAALFVFDILKRIGLQPAATVYMQSVVEEESTGNGALMTHLRGYKADAALIPEPSSEKIVRGNVGVVWFQFETRGHPVHVHTMGTGANAIDAAYRVIGELRKIEAELNEKVSQFPHYAHLSHPINLNIGKIAGGDWASSVPAWCKVDCRLSLFPGMDPHDLAKEIEDRVAAFARSDNFLANHPPRITFNGFMAQGYILEPGSEAERVLAGAHENVFHKPLEESILPAYLDGRVYALYDNIPALNYGPLGYDMHGFDERCSIESLRKVTKTIALFVTEWCGVEAI